MNRHLRLMPLCMLPLVLTSCRFVPPTVAEATSTLEEAGYTVDLSEGTGKYGDDSSHFLFTVSSVDEVLHGEKGEDEIYLIYFYSIDDASFEYDFIFTPNGYTKGSINNMVYVGTPQAVKDAKL